MRSRIPSTIRSRSARPASGPLCFWRGAPYDPDARGGRDPLGQPRVALLDLLQGQGLRHLEKVDERVRPGGDDPDAVVLAGPAHAAEHPREILLEVIHESLEESRGPLGPERLEHADEPPALALARIGHRGGVRREEVLE